MQTILQNRFYSGLIAFLMIANAGTLVFFWAGHFKNQSEHSPKEFLAKQLNFTQVQRTSYFDLAKEHNEEANKIREAIKIDKDNLFRLLKSERVSDIARDSAALKVSSSLQALDILTFEHFKKVRALCTEEQKPQFDELIQKMVNLVNNPQRGPQPSPSR